MKPEDIYDAAGLPSPGDPNGEYEAFLWNELLDQSREPDNAGSFFIVNEIVGNRRESRYVAPDWPSAEAYAKERLLLLWPKLEGNKRHTEFGFFLSFATSGKSCDLPVSSLGLNTVYANAFGELPPRSAPFDMRHVLNRIANLALNRSERQARVGLVIADKRISAEWTNT